MRKLGHGPPISGRDEITERVTRARDAIQFLWDQTVRHTNKGATSPAIGHAVRLPDHCDADPLTSEFYGVAEHHVRQIRSGLFGFFDGDPAQLFPVEPVERAARLVAGFGGADAVRSAARAALADDDVRWTIELASWLVQAPDATDPDRELLADALRVVAQRTSSANVRNWCLTRARDLDGSFSMDRYRTHRFARRAVIADPAASVEALRVLADPDALVGVDLRIGWDFESATAAVHVRNCVAVSLGPDERVDVTLRVSAESWAEVMGRTVGVAALVERGDLVIDGDAEAAMHALAGFDIGTA